MSRLSLWFPLFVALLGMSEAVVAENMADCAAGWKAEEAGEYMHSAELTARCIANEELTEATKARAWRNLGIALRSGGQAKKALEAFQIAISMKPADVWKDLVNLGNAYSDLKEYEKALKAYDMAQKSAPNVGDIEYNRGLVFERMERITDAKAEYLKAFNSGLRSKQLGERIIALGLYEQLIDSW